MTKRSCYCNELDSRNQRYCTWITNGSYPKVQWTSMAFESMKLRNDAVLEGWWCPYKMAFPSSRSRNPGQPILFSDGWGFEVRGGEPRPASLLGNRVGAWVVGTVARRSPFRCPGSRLDCQSVPKSLETWRFFCQARPPGKQSSPCAANRRLEPATSSVTRTRSASGRT